jgi:L-alanine-DL-glutamate epimerase-like enolase superfamily enzyme
MAKNPPEVKGGWVHKPDGPGLGVDLDDAGVRQFQGPNDSTDWV